MRWLGLVPFASFALALIVMPVATLVKGSLTGPDGPTLEFYAQLTRPLYMRAFANSLVLSAVTALLAVVIGLPIAQAIVRSRSSSLRRALIALSDVTTNFAGAPLAFSFIVLLGSTGIVTRVLLEGFGIGLYPSFSIYSLPGLTLAYLYFQLPLMVLLIIPALEGLRREWKEAAQNLGASSWQYWRLVGWPILAPAVFAGFVLLFANAFGAFATAYTLVGSDLDLATLQIAFLISGDVRHDPALASAMAVVMLAIMAVSVASFRVSQRRFARWA